MNYHQFRQYRARYQVAADEQPCWELNPYPLRQYLHARNANELTIPQGFVQKTKGIRHALGMLFEYFSSQGCVLAIPNDIYPEYQRIADGLDKALFSSQGQNLPNFPELERCCLLLSNPLVPSGKYLTAADIRAIESWLNASDQRFLLIDSAYDFRHRNYSDLVELPRTVILSSQTKLALQPQTLGWMWSALALPFLSRCQQTTFTTYSQFLDGQFGLAWQQLYEQQPWLAMHAPDAGYLTRVDMDIDALKAAHGILAIPESVFGGSSTRSVISCLEVVYDQLQ